MYKDKKIIYMKALTPIHAGAGQTLGNVDMPIQRERHSNIPKIEASSLKGSIKHLLYNKLKNNDERFDSEKELYTIFGPENSEENHASAIGFTDAKLLLFPIKSATDIFKLITCPYVLKRWAEDLRLQDNFKEDAFNISDLKVGEGKCITNSNDPIILEEYIFEKVENLPEIFKENSLKNITDLALCTDKIVILNDSDFIDLVTMYTEIITRNKIEVKTGAAKGTGLFTEEYLPTETILYFSVLASPSFDEKKTKTSEYVLNYFDKNVDEVFQVGGNATIGKGFVKRSGKRSGKVGEK